MITNDADIGPFVGEVLRPGDAGYDETRRVHNGMVDKRPALIARCLGVADVVAAVNFERGRQAFIKLVLHPHLALNKR